RDRLRERDERFAEDLSEDDRIARDRRDEDLLTEVLFAIDEQEDHAECGRLPDRLRERAGEDEMGQVDAGAVAEARLQHRAEDADEDEREREVRDDPCAVAQELDQIAVREREHRRQLAHHGVATASSPGLTISKYASASGGAGVRTTGSGGSMALRIACTPRPPSRILNGPAPSTGSSRRASSSRSRRRSSASTSTYSCTRSRLISSGVPNVTILPLSRMQMWSASSASSRKCVVRKIVVPDSRRIVLRDSQSVRRLGTSRPAVGSSRNSTFGLWMRLRTISSLRRMPLENVLIGLPRSPAMPRSSASLVTCARYAAGMSEYVGA